MNTCTRFFTLLAEILALVSTTALATDNYEYGTDEYVTISNGISPNGKLAITAHGEGDLGYDNFHIYLFDTLSGKRIGPLEEIVDPLDTGAGSYGAKWSKDSSEVTIVYRVDRHAPLKAMTYQLANGRAIPSSKKPVNIPDNSELVRLWGEYCSDAKPSVKVFGTPKKQRFPQCESVIKQACLAFYARQLLVKRVLVTHAHPRWLIQVHNQNSVKLYFITVFCIGILLIAETETTCASDVLRYLQGCSDVILVGEITVAPDMVSGSAPIQPGIPYWQESTARLKIVKVLKGKYDVRADPLITLRIPLVSGAETNWESALEQYAKGTKHIFFLQDRRQSKELGTAGLNGEPVYLVAFDQFLSVQPHTEATELEIRNNGK